MASTRFFGSVDRPNNNTEPATSPLDELNESDVVWSSTSTDPVAEDSSSYPVAVTVLKAGLKTINGRLVHAAASPLSTSFTSPRHFHPPAAADAGLSTALSAADGDEDSGGARRLSSPLIQRKKTALNPSLSPAGAAAISTVVPPPPPVSTSSSAAFVALSRSAPVKVPMWNVGRGIRRGRYVGDPMVLMSRFEEEGGDDDDGEGFDDGEEIVPPHEIVGRSHRTTTFSVFEGVGRTLKGRDLTTVRNAVMQKTGFLE